jgi:hypothetical protein
LFTSKSNVNLIYEIKANKRAFFIFSIHKTFQRKQDKNMSILVALDPEANPQH